MTWNERLLSEAESSEATAEYRTVSMRAVVSFGLGLLSPLAFVHYLLWIVPLLAFVTSLVTLRFLQHGDPLYRGRRLALAGMFLGAFCLVAAPAEAVVWRVVVVRQSRQFADEWIKLLLEGEKRRAHYWSLAYSARPRSESSYVRYYRDETYQRRVDEFFLREPLRQLLGNPDVDLEWLGAGEIVGTVKDCYLAHRYRARFADGREEVLVVTVQRERTPDEGRIHWEIAAVYFENHTGHRH